LAPLARSRRRLLGAAVLLGLLGPAAAFWVRPHLTAWYHFRAARSALNHYHNREAIEHLRICLKTWPADADALFLAARIARRVGNYVEAEIALNKYQAQRGYDGAAALERILLHAERGDVDRAAGCCKYWIDQGHPDAPFIFEAMVRGYVHAYRLPE